MPSRNPLFCFASTTIEIHSCPTCRAPMTITSDDFGNPTYRCFKCDHVDENSLLKRDASI
jgi:hypothetical protein